MATAPHNTLDGSRPTASERAIASRGEGYLPVLVNEEISHSREQHLSSAARMEAQRWEVTSTKKGIQDFERRVNLASESIYKAGQYLARRVSNGASLEKGPKALHDNARLLREAITEIRAGLQGATNLPQVVSADGRRVPRAYAAAVGYLNACDAHFDEREFVIFFSAIQEHAAFKMKEIGTLKAFVQLAFVERVAAYSERFIPEKLASALDSNLVIDNQPASAVQALLVSLRRLDAMDWVKTFDRVNTCEQILREDPAGAYARMEPEGRADYRRAIEKLAERSKWTEPEIARVAVLLASAAKPGLSERAEERRSHVGYFLVDAGRDALEERIGYKPLLSERVMHAMKRWPESFYLLGIEFIVVALITLLVVGAQERISAFLVMMLFFLPAADCAIALMNQLSTSFFRPRSLPKLDFSEGIPSKYTTLVIVPTLLITPEQVKRAVHDLEVRFHGNRDRNLHFGLLTDPPDSNKQFDDKDALAGLCATLIEDLNRRYAPEGRGTFFLLHRHRSYNPSEQVWMGWERKRGKLIDLNKLILGQEDNFPVKVGELDILKTVRYVLTLDLDTQLPRDAARKMVGAIAHPLNRAVIDPASNTVVEGYGIFQPRVDISIHSANRSRLASIFSGETGLDVYTRAVSDVYQDLFGEGSFTGKGIYEVSTFQKVLEHRFPCNTILSHDMIEGAYARAGLLSDVEVVDDYPSRMAAYSRRKHRWVRGDWQIIFWLLPRVPDYFGKLVRNPISIISRWKILDNLRRSVTEVAFFVMFVSAWLMPGKPLYWTLATFAVFVLPSYFQLALSVLRAGRALFTAAFWRNWAGDFTSVHANLFLRLACLCYQSMVSLDAIVRAVVRMTITHERLLEWETAAEAELVHTKRSPVDIYLSWTPWLVLFIGVFLAVDRPASFWIAFPFLTLWGLAKVLCRWLDQPLFVDENVLPEADETLLRTSALRTWRFFREFSNESNHWLIPDHYQQTPEKVANLLSTTNLGMLLNSRLAAMDLGHLTLEEFIDLTGKTLGTVRRLRTSRGHLYNWYDNETLEPVGSPFLSTVDNGNLACCLWTLKQGAIEAKSQPIFSPALWQGIRDHIEILDELLRAAGVTPHSNAVLTVHALQLRAADLGSDAAAWIEASPVLEDRASDLQKLLQQSGVSQEAHWWANELKLRLAAINKLVRDFAPWLAPQFAQAIVDAPVVELPKMDTLTLENAAAAYAEIDRIVDATSLGARGHFGPRVELQYLRDAVQQARLFVEGCSRQLAQIVDYADSIVNGMDFALLYNEPKKLMSIGFDAEQETVSVHHYDLLASEARSAVFIGIAKGDVPQECWFKLTRLHTYYKGEHVLLSWTGTMFEYLMPMLWMKSYSSTILDHSAQAVVHAQRMFARKRRVPWGISESSCGAYNPDGHYTYRAFGVPDVALNSEADHSLVVSPYSTFLALMVDVPRALRNLRKMAKLGWLGEYGFYEAADFTPSRLTAGKKHEVVKTWMAHHQGMSLLAAANTLCDESIRRRFHTEPQVAATERLLHERAPAVFALQAKPVRTKDARVPLIFEQHSVLRPGYWGSANDLHLPA